MRHFVYIIFVSQKLKENDKCGVVFVTLSLDAVSCVGLDTWQTDRPDLKKNNFLLTSSKCLLFND